MFSIFKHTPLVGRLWTFDIHIFRNVFNILDFLVRDTEIKSMVAPGQENLVAVEERRGNLVFDQMPSRTSKEL